MPDSAEAIETRATVDVQLRHVDQLVPYQNNARTHSPEQVAALAAAIEEFGYTNPIIADEKGIVAGHGRLLAVRQLIANSRPIRTPSGVVLPEGFVPVIDCSGWTEAKRRAYVLWDNTSAEQAGWDNDLLKLELSALQGVGYDLHFTGFSTDFLTELGFGATSDGAAPGPGHATGAGSLAERFGVPPFSVLNAREGWWQARKAAWLSLGIRSEVGRGENLLKMSDTALEPDPVKRAAMQAARAKAAAEQNRDEHGESVYLKGALTVKVTPDAYSSRAKHKAIPGGGSGANSAWKFKTAEGYKTNSEIDAVPAGLAFGEMPNYDGAARSVSGTSIFDPVLCELAYRWFCPPGGQIIDPFAGGSVRGIVAAKLGRRYQGHELRPEQVEANRAQGAELCAEAAEAERLTWIEGDSRATIPPSDIEADLVFSCPPYGDLEVYSAEDDDLSNMEHDEFLAAYREIIAAAVGKLKPDRFACFVVGEFRDKKGALRSFVPDTIAAFEAAGARFYNDAILVTSVGSLPIRAGKQFATTRKLGRTHQYVLVFVKGDPAKATAAIGECDFGEMAPEGGAIISEPSDEGASPAAPVPFDASAPAQ